LLYRDGLAICPDDDVAHYELGRALADAGRRAEAEKEFETALKINPDFGDARRQLDTIRTNR
jgi:tetratricopeptide (TPR) repeat protein